MARKIKSKTTTTRAKQTSAKKTAAPVEKTTWFRWGESYTSLLLGIVVVVIAILFVGSIIKLHHTTTTKEITATSTTNPVQIKKQRLSQQTYVIAVGDSLWTISQKFYNSGYNWVDIAKANNLDNPGTINAGNTLIIPSISPTPTAMPGNFGETTSPTPTPSVVSMPTSIKANTYTIQKGDDLWNIALRAYGDGYKWVDIAKANNLDNPGLIFSGNVLTIPR